MSQFVTSFGTVSKFAFIQDIEMLNRILASTKSKSIKDDIHNKIR